MALRDATAEVDKTKALLQAAKEEHVKLESTVNEVRAANV